MDNLLIASFCMIFFLVSACGSEAAHDEGEAVDEMEMMENSDDMMDDDMDGDAGMSDMEMAEDSTDHGGDMDSMDDEDGHEGMEDMEMDEGSDGS